MTYKTLLTSTNDRIGTITINRPNVLNALNTTVFDELQTAIRAFDSNPTIKVIILTGHDRAFAAGVDIADMAQKSFHDVYSTDFFTFEAARAINCRKPIIAAVSGYALGGGCEIAMMCDMIIASDTARFGQPEITLGIIAGLGGTQRMPRAIGKAKAMDMHLTGRFMDAVEAERAGLISRIVAPDQLYSETHSIATKIAEHPLPALIAAKEAINRAYEMPLQEGILFEHRLFHALFATKDQKEGMQAFLQKRKPNFQDQ